MIRHKGYGADLYDDIMSACIQYHWDEADKVKTQYILGAMFTTWCYVCITPRDYAAWYTNFRLAVERLESCGISVPRHI